MRPPITLAREQFLGGRRFGAGSFVRYRGRHENGSLSDVRLGEDQEVDGLPCRRGALIMFHANQRLSYLHLASDHDVDGIPCASGDLEVSFHKNGRLAVATLAREHALAGRHPGEPERKLRDPHAWVETLHELSIEAGEAIEDPLARDGLVRFLRGGKAAKPAQALLDLRLSDGRTVRSGAAVHAIHQRLRRAEGWARRRAG
jgi:hypothetical protein